MGKCFLSPQLKMKHKKLTLLLICFLISRVGILGQINTTVFIDSLKIVTNGDTIQYGNREMIFFIDNKETNSLEIYNKGDYKVILNFNNYLPIPYSRNFKINQYYNPISENHVPNILELRYKNQEIHFGYWVDKYGDLSRCGMEEQYLSTRNWNLEDQLPEKIDLVELKYRYTYSIPKNQADYSYPYREGTWIAKDTDSKELIAEIPYHQDKREGIATVYFKNGSYQKVKFQNDSIVGDIKDYNKKGKEKTYFIRLAHDFIYCGEDKNISP